MKKLMFAAIVALAGAGLSVSPVFASSCHSADGSCTMETKSKTGDDKAASGEKATAYACPMHPEATGDKPGKCPKCGMNLVEMQAAEAADVKPSVAKKEAAPKKAAPAKLRKDARPATYACPMHPEVTSSTPGKCAKCGMFLEKK